MVRKFLAKMTLPKTLSYEDARAVLEKQNHQATLELAARPDARPEMLYYLADEGSDDVRRAVAANPGTPQKANELLAVDRDDEVRVELSRKIARLLPDIDSDTGRQLRDSIIDVLRLLAQDQAPRVRQVLAEELKASPEAPRDVICRLAQDNVSEVCVPILEYSPLLRDEDLREIIAYSRAEGALAAVARRQGVSEAVAADIAKSLDIPAVAALLANRSAHIREDTLNFIVDHAADIMTWHQPLALRPNLSVRLMRRIAGFVASALVQEMINRNDLGAGDGEALLGRVRDRIASQPIHQDDMDAMAVTVADLHRKGVITDDFVQEAIDENRRELVVHVLALLADLDVPTVQRILATKDGRRVTALVWKAGLGMRTAYRVQVDIALVPSQKLLYARNGVDYPLTSPQLTESLRPYVQ